MNLQHRLALHFGKPCNVARGRLTRFFIAGLCILGTFQSFWMQSESTCKMLVWGPASALEHTCSGEGGECKNCSVVGTCVYDTGYVGDWQICRCVCENESGKSVSDCYASFQYNTVTGAYRLTCEDVCCISWCLDKTDSLFFDYNSDPCKCYQIQ